MKLSFSWSPLNFIEISANSNLCSWSSSSTSSLKLVFIFQPAIVAEYNKYDSKIVMRLTIKLSYFFSSDFSLSRLFLLYHALFLALARMIRLDRRIRFDE
jgi:hypothetical protein